MREKQLPGLVIATVLFVSLAPVFAQSPFQSDPGPAPQPDARPAPRPRASVQPARRAAPEPAEPQQPRSAPVPVVVVPPAPVFPFDGTYTGAVTAVSDRGGRRRHLNCEAGKQVQMKVVRGAVFIQQSMVDGDVVDYHGGVDAAGSVNASNTGFDGFVFTVSGSISQGRFAGELRRRGCYFTVQLTKG